MIKPRENLIGQRFNRLVVLERLDDVFTSGGNGVVMYLCKCDCGNITKVRAGHLRSGHTNSCGCYKKDKTIETHRTVASNNPRLHKIWVKMRERCRNPNNKSYGDYGGRGIKVCDEWQNFEVFYEWSMSNGYSDDLSIDRIDVNGNYEPSNCRWTTMKEQARNKRCNVLIEDKDGQMLILQVFSDKYNIKRSTIKYRLNQGDRGERLVRPIDFSNKYEYKNEW